MLVCFIGPAVFTVGIGYGDAIGRSFTKTLRNTGYKGDLVVATGSKLGKEVSSVLKNDLLQLNKTVQSARAIVYPVALTCMGDDGVVRNYTRCRFREHDEKHAIHPVPISMIRLYMYKWWATMYKRNATILIADFRDVIFQSNPFIYRRHTWAPESGVDLTVFQDAYPMKAIERSVDVSGWLEKCYGHAVLTRLGSNVVSNSGVVMGSRDGVLVYVSIVCCIL